MRIPSNHCPRTLGRYNCIHSVWSSAPLPQRKSIKYRDKRLSDHTIHAPTPTNVAGVWAIGDCNGRGAFTHTSYNDHEIVAANLFDGDSRKISDRIPCYALYTDPRVGRAGMTMREARASEKRVLVGHRPMSKVSSAREMSETSGFMRALVDADTQQILGAVVFGVGGDEMVHSLLDVMYAHAPYTTISRAVHIHPTISELIPTMLQDLKPLD